ncbi:hypothetical protein RAK27_13260 [Carnobacterium maltaromaticum]|uniref:Uncharacterized protein n=1 Tax=Carnobacterium maltaromaticum TaxID=2751 RepID=A0AAW9K1K7_CARML|nr:hypothetical protein [Carnobacterium maltaromaticum]MDZ5759626.1 hypothetical protein [Carnobacterium maltaromaticum]
MTENNQLEGIIAAYVQFESEEERILTRLFIFSDTLVEEVMDNQLEEYIKATLLKDLKKIKHILNVSILDTGLIYK